MIRIMDEERYDQLYNRILDGENWDYSTLDELLDLAYTSGREKALAEAQGNVGMDAVNDSKEESLKKLFDSLPTPTPTEPRLGW